MTCIARHVILVKLQKQRTVFGLFSSSLKGAVMSSLICTLLPPFEVDYEETCSHCPRKKKAWVR
jgi:hypothetical protein